MKKFCHKIIVANDKPASGVCNHFVGAGKYVATSCADYSQERKEEKPDNVDFVE